MAGVGPRRGRTPGAGGAPRPARAVTRPGPPTGTQPIGWPVTALIITVERPPPTTAAASATVADRQVVPTRRSSTAMTRLLTSASPNRGAPAISEAKACARGNHTLHR